MTNPLNADSLPMAQSNTQKPLVLVDGSNYLYRAFHASERANLRTAAGEPTGAIRLMINMLRKLQGTYPESPVVVVFDAKGNNFRHDMYDDYKATRKPMPDDLRPQVEPVYKAVQALGMTLLIVENVEADDVIGTLATQATKQAMTTVISTGDKDLAQLVSEYVTLIDTMKETQTDLAGVVERFGIPAHLMVDYLALVGDTSDNIPGMPGVGEKTAVALLQGIGGIEEIGRRLDEVAALGFRGSKNFATKFAEHKEIIQLSYALATIKTDVELPVSVADLKAEPIDKPVLIELCQRYEFRTLLQTLASEGEAPGDSPAVTPEPVTPTADYQTILEQADFERWLEKLKAAELFAFDTETTSLDYMEAEIVGLSFATSAGEAAYVPLAHDYLDAPNQLDRITVLNTLKPLLEDENRKKVGQNLKYDRSILLRYDIDLKGIAFDTMLESYVLNSTATRHNMDALAENYLGLQTIKFEDIAGKGAKQLTFNQIALEQAAPYAAEDADVTLRLHQALWPQLEQEPKLAVVFHELEMPLVPVLSRIERNGALVDAKLLGLQSRELTQSLQQLQDQAWTLAGEEFNLSSPKQLQTLLFEKLQLPVLKKTPKGQPSTAEDVLEELAQQGHELPRLIMAYRGLSKLKSTYTDKLPKMINPRTGRVHTSYHQAVTATGRLSSSDPNLQNIPVRTEEGRRIRQAFIAKPGYKLVAADYSQIELRIMAHLSGDQGLLEAFANGLDVHKATAAEVFGVSLNEVTSDQRRSAKAINFGLIYGMSAFGLAKQLGIGRADAQQYVQRYFERYPGVQDYMERTRKQAHELGYVETIYGRRLYLPDINAGNKMRQQAAERTAINAPMQGTAADIIKKAMISVDSWLQESQHDARMIMQVHDELVLEVKEELVEQVVAELKARMAAAATLAVPLIVDVGVGNNWDEAH